MGTVSVAEAARRLGVNVQRIHQRIADGSIEARRVGSQWVIDDSTLSMVAEIPHGRPLSRRSAWAVIDLAARHADDGHLPAVAPVERARAKERLGLLFDLATSARSGSAAYDALVPQLSSRVRALLRNRAKRVCYRANSIDLQDIREDTHVQLSGLSLSESGLASSDVVEGYVADYARERIVDDYLLVDSNRHESNVVLHLVQPADIPGWRVQPTDWLLLAADLAEHRGPREEARAAQVIREAAETWTWDD